jgi:uncharacterized membrane protein YsdA (DUF1294 family)
MKSSRSRSRRSASFSVGTAVVILEFVLCLTWLVGPAPEWAKLLVAAVNIMAFMMYLVDKQSAAKGEWRIPEKYLFAVTLFGGVMGADFARRLYRHKTQKPAFNACVFIALLVQVALLGAVAQLPVEAA